jgi:hypothetical protein
MQGSLKRKLSRHERENLQFQADTLHAIEQPLPFDAPLTENQAKAFARSVAKRQELDGERQARAEVDAANKAWLAQNDWLWEK